MASSVYLVAASYHAPLIQASIGVSCSARSNCGLLGPPSTCRSLGVGKVRNCWSKVERRRSSSSLSPRCCATLPESEESEEEEGYMKDLHVPSEWLAPSVAAQEAEWLRGALHQWLDDEYCPEPANEEISRRCAKVYYYCLLEEQVDIGDILMQMVRDLETFSFKESFHGAFSSANAAIELITKRMDQMDNSSTIQQSSSS